MPKTQIYQRIVESRFRIVDKEQHQVNFFLNSVQKQFLLEDFDNKCIVLKARQQGFSSLITAMFTVEFLMNPNTYNVIVADNAENAEGLLVRVKSYLEQWELKTQTKIPLKYNSKYHLYLPQTNCTFQIGTAQNANLARSKTVSNLHLSEAAFYPNLNDIMAGAVQAVVPKGRIIMETTANGYNEFKTFWDRSVNGDTGYKSLFYRASDFYSQAFLDQKRIELGDKFTQEYPETPEEAFISSGNKYFESFSLQKYLEEVQHSQEIPQFTIR